jgi:hypothetical protein
MPMFMMSCSNFSSSNTRGVTPRAPEPWSERIIFPRAASEGAVRSLALASLWIPKKGLFSGGSATRCRAPSSSAMHEKVPKRNIAPRQRVILFLKVMAIELALINDTPLPGAPAVGV